MRCWAVGGSKKLGMGTSGLKLQEMIVARKCCKSAHGMLPGMSVHRVVKKVAVARLMRLRIVGMPTVWNFGMQFN